MADRFNSVAGGNWNSTSSWATTDGGAGPASFPVAGDRVFITGNGGTITVNVSSACGDFSKTGATLAGSAALAIGGSASFAGTITYTGTITYNATATGKTIAHNGKQLSSNVTFNGVGGGWSNTDAGSTTGTVTLTNGAINDGGFNQTMSVFSSSNGNTRSITKTGKWTITGTGTCVNLGNTTGLTFSASGGWAFSDSSATARTFAAGGLTFSGKTEVPAGSGTFTISGGVGTFGGFDFTGFTGSLTTVSAPNCTGDVVLGAGMTITTTAANWTMIGPGAQTFKSNGVMLDRTLRVDAVSGSVTLLDALNIGAHQLIHASGTLTDGGFSVTAGALNSNFTNTRTLNKTGLWTITGGTGNNAVNIVATGLTFSDAGGWKLTEATASNRLFTCGSQSFSNVWIAPGAGTGGYTFQGSGTFSQIKDDGSAAHPLAFDPTGTYSIADWQVNGTAGNMITLASSTPGSQFTLTKTGGGKVTADYLSASDMVGAGNGYCWFLGAHSVNGGNNLGVAFCTAANASMMAAAA